MTQQEPLDEITPAFQRAWELLAANPVIVVPGLLLAVAAGVLIAVLVAFAIGSYALVSTTGSVTIGYVTGSLGVIVAIATTLFVALLQMVVVTGMSGAAWRTGTASLRDGWAAFVGQWPRALGAIALVFLIGICAAVLAPVTFLLSLLAFVVFFMYVIPAVVLDGLRPGAAIAESCRIAQARFVPTLLLAVLLVALSLVGAAVGAMMSHIVPVTGALTGLVVQQAVAAYATLVVVGIYLKLRREATV
jgi:hypothetical protein